MHIVKDKKINLIISIIFMITSLAYFIATRGYLSLLQWGALMVSLVLVYYLNRPLSQKNHLRIIIGIISYFVIYALMTFQNFIEFPIPFNNNEYLIFTITFNITWLIFYIYLMYHKNHEDVKYFYYILTTVLVLFKTFTQSIRTISYIRGYLTVALTPMGQMVIIISIILMIISLYAILNFYLIKSIEEMDLKSLRFKSKKNTN